VTEPSVHICDTTLRDGSHARSHSITVAEVSAVVGALDAAGVPYIEVAHGEGLGGSSLQYGRSTIDEYELIEAAVAAARDATIAVLLLPGIGRREDLTKARDLGVGLVRVATHCTEADIAQQHLGLAAELGMVPIGFLMMAHMVEPEVLAAQARIMADSGAQAVYITDSAGALVPGQVAERVAALRDELGSGVGVGFHGHHNLGLGVSNAWEAITAGATWIDSSTCGMGAGAGNTPTELLVAVLSKLGVDTGVDEFLILDAAQHAVRPILASQPTADRSAVLLGLIGIYSSFLLHAERAAQRFDVDAKDILLELGRRGAVGGQEDLIVEVAAALATPAWRSGGAMTNGPQDRENP
jgi:4-hydroxy 2-oxovalerate aldolase